MDEKEQQELNEWNETLKMIEEEFKKMEGGN